MARTAGRIVLTFVPIILLKNAKSRHGLKKNPNASEEKVTRTLNKIKARTRVFQILLSIPTVLILATVLASLERTPLTGRWRLIILSPEEEEEIAAQLAGPGWYNAVGEILSQDGSTKLVPPNDWRYLWVSDTLRRLEATIPTLVSEGDFCPEWVLSDGRPLPPPADFPLRPRPRASDNLRMFCERMCSKKIVHPGAHTIPGPPYSLLVVDKPDSANAFSYGFGPNGGGGVVVYSGFLDNIFAHYPPVYEPVEESWLSSLFSGFLLPSRPPHPIPTREQTSELAILLAHELAHLVLAHHLETLSSINVFIPGTLSIVSDIVRVLLFPVTMLFGPFVNDAVAQLGKVGSGELMKLGDYCTSVHQEIEADVVSARLLAHAGFDARDAVAFWENRACTPEHSESKDCVHPGVLDSRMPYSERLARQITGTDHPVNDVRVDRLKRELLRWETERRAALARLQHPPQQSSILLPAA